MDLRQNYSILLFSQLNIQVHSYSHRVMSTSARADLPFPGQPISPMSFLRHITISQT